jgi:hypothetical protein
VISSWCSWAAIGPTASHGGVVESGYLWNSLVMPSMNVRTMAGPDGDSASSIGRGTVKGSFWLWRKLRMENSRRVLEWSLSSAPSTGMLTA